MKDKAIKEYNDLKEKTNVELSNEEGITFLTSISEAESKKDIDTVRINLIVSYSKFVLDQCDNIIDSFSKRLADVKEYNESLIEMGKELESLSQLRKDDEDIIRDCHSFFKNAWEFFEKIIKNEKNIIIQSRKHFWSSILPQWGYLLSAGWIALVGLFLFFDKIEFSPTSIIFIITGWLLILIAGGFLLKIFIYGFKLMDKETSVYIKEIKGKKKN